VHEPTAQETEQIHDALNTRGWDLLLETFQRQYEVANELAGVSSFEDVCFRKGQMAILWQLLNLRDEVKQIMDEGESDADL